MFHIFNLQNLKTVDVLVSLSFLLSHISLCSSHHYRNVVYKYYLSLMFVWPCIIVNNINSQLDAAITYFIDNYNRLNMFRAAVSIVGALYHKL